MKLKQITKLLFAIFIAYTLGSCNSDSTEYTVSGASKDAQIYRFKLSAIAYTKQDSVSYPVLAKTMFSIDQFKQSIYNVDSLPYKTSLRKVYASISFGSSSPSKLQIIYPDSVSVWNGSDSIDFSRVPKIKVTAADGSTSIEYSVDVRIHKVDPDTLMWTKMANLKQPASITGKQKTLLIDNTFYTFSIDSDNKLYLYKADKSTAYQPKQVVNGLNGNKIKLESITFFNNSFYAVDSDNKAYVSDKQGVTWGEKSTNIVNIIGILPSSSEEKDMLLVLAQKDNKTYLARTSNLDKDKLIYESSAISENFPVSGFSSVTNYNRSSLNYAILAISGGKTQSGAATNLTWSFQLDGDALRIIPNQSHSVFNGQNGVVTFLYASYLYALVNNKFYKSASYGAKWSLAPNKEILDTNIPKASKQSVIVDTDNYIWIFGGIKDADGASVQDVWRGRINRLNP